MKGSEEKQAQSFIEKFPRHRNFQQSSSSKGPRERCLIITQGSLENVLLRLGGDGGVESEQRASKGQMEGAGPIRTRVWQVGPEKPAAKGDGFPILQLSQSPELQQCVALEASMADEDLG